MKSMEGKFYIKGTIGGNPVIVHTIDKATELTKEQLKYIEFFYNTTINKFECEVYGEHTVLLHRK